MKHILFLLLMGLSALTINAEVINGITYPQLYQTQEINVPGFLSGTVTVKIRLDEKGNVTLIENISGDKSLKPYAEKLVTEFLVFSPTLKNGNPIPSVIQVPLVF